MEVFFYRREVMRVAIVHIRHGPDDRFRPTTSHAMRAVLARTMAGIRGARDAVLAFGRADLYCGMGDGDPNG